MALFGGHGSGRRGRRRPRGPWCCNWFESRAAKGRRDIELVAMATQRRERRPQPSGHLLQFILSIERMVPAARYLICIYTHRQTCFKMLRASPRGPQGQRRSPPPSTCRRRRTRSKSFFLINSALSNFDAHGTEYSDANFLRRAPDEFCSGSCCFAGLSTHSDEMGLHGVCGVDFGK